MISLIVIVPDAGESPALRGQLRPLAFVDIVVHFLLELARDLVFHLAVSAADLTGAF